MNNQHTDDMRTVGVVKAIAQTNLDYLAHSIGFKGASIGEPVQNGDTWDVVGEIYKGSYRIRVKLFEGGDKPVFSVVVFDIA